MSLQPGKYFARAIPESVQFGRATTGTQQIAITFRILDGVTNGVETGNEITWIGALGNEKSLEITAKALRACGCEDPEDLDKGFAIPDARANGVQPSEPARAVDDIPF